MVNSGEIKLESGYDSLKKYGFPGDFKFVLIERIMLRDFKLSNIENIILTLRGLVRQEVHAVSLRELFRQASLEFGR